MLDRRAFLSTISLPAGAAMLGLATALPDPARAAGIARDLASHPGDAKSLAGDDDFWAEVGLAFTVDRSLVNLNNGGVSPSPAFVQEAMKRHLDFSNTCPPHALWTVLEPQREGVRERLGLAWGVSPEEIAITRNASESLQICQLGFNLKPGDEVLANTQDYPRMITTFQQRERREGIKLVQLQVPIPMTDPAALIEQYDAAITKRTRLMLVSHVINITGQIMPVKELCALGRRRGVPVIVDGAHSFAHLDFALPDLDCDYFATSLHKWLFAPHGTGLLYVRRDKIDGLWPMMAAPASMDANIRKFEEIGTHPAANFLAIGEALTFHRGIGGARKEARLRYLRDTWAQRLLAHPSGRVRLHASLDPRFSCGIATVEVDGLDTAKLSDWLWKSHRILTVAILHPEFKGLRVTPSVYTTMEELDRFCLAMEAALRDGLPA